MSARGALREVFRRDRVLGSTGAFLLLQAGVCLLLMPFDDQTILGVDRWLKPFKFSVSVGIYLWTVAWFLPYLKNPRRLRLHRALRSPGRRSLLAGNERQSFGRALNIEGWIAVKPIERPRVLHDLLPFRVVAREQ